MLRHIHYINTGDWVESCTAVVEHHDGTFEVVDWSGMRPRAEASEVRPRAQAAA
jgi:hypothetical protein